jgi:hypothetical protein
MYSIREKLERSQVTDADVLNCREYSDAPA